MRRIRTAATLGAILGAALWIVASGAACRGNNDHAATQGSGGGKVELPAPARCPPGNVVKDGACIVVVTPAKIAAVTTQQGRLVELAKLLEQADALGAPIEVLDRMRQLPPWKALAKKSDRFAAADALGGALDKPIKALRAFKVNLGEASARLGNVRGQLDWLMTDTGTIRRLEDARAKVSEALRAALEPLGGQTQETIQDALVPLIAQLSRVSSLVVTACAMAELSGGGDRMKELCTQAADGFTRARAYVDELKGKPAHVFDQVTGQLETELDLLIDAETRTLLDAARTKVDEAVAQPVAAPGSGASPGRGSGR